MNASWIRYLSIACGAIAVALLANGQPAVLTGNAAAYERALYPHGLPQRRNVIADVAEKPELVVAAEAAIPETSRRVIVYAERLSRDLPFDKIYTVYVAVLERREKEFVVLDQRDVTEEIEVFTEFPGNFLELRGQAIPLPSGRTPIVAVELWAVIDGTGAICEATHLFYAIDHGGKLEQVLELKATYGSGRSGAVRNSRISTVSFASAPDGVGDVVVRTRAVTWSRVEGDAEQQCGPVSLSRYRFDGTKFQEMDAPSGLPDHVFILPHLPVEEPDTCDDHARAATTN
jgi:hypothetical protein